MRRCIALFELAYFFGEKPNELLYDFGERGRRTQLLISEAMQLSCAGGHVLRDLDAVTTPAAQPATSELSVQQLNHHFC